MEQELIFSREIYIFILKLLVHQMNNLLQKDSNTAHTTFHFKASLHVSKSAFRLFLKQCQQMQTFCF